MASAPTKITNGQLPAGLVPAYGRIACSSHSDTLAIVAMLSGKSLEDVMKLAMTLGMRRFNYWVDENLIRQLLFSLSPLAVGNWKEFTSVAAMPDRAIWLVEYDSKSETGKAILFVHSRGTSAQQAVSYVIDPSELVSDAQKITTDFSHLNVKGSYYLELTTRPNPNGTKPK